MTEIDCGNKGSYCEHIDGSLSLLSGDFCTNCRGSVKYRYSWTKNAAADPAAESTTIADVINVAKTSSAKQVSRQTMNDYQQYLQTFVNLFQAFACDCGPKRRSGCFENLTELVVKECMVDPAYPHECGNIFMSPVWKKTDIPVTLSVHRFSSANFIKNNTLVTLLNRAGGIQNSETLLEKRCNPLSDYEVVYSGFGGSVIGQIIGNGVMMKQSSDSYSEIYICLKIDQSIPMNKVKYPVYDIGYVFDKAIYPLKPTVSVKVDGLKVCGTVSNFPEIVYIPILRQA